VKKIPFQITPTTFWKHCCLPGILLFVALFFTFCQKEKFTTDAADKLAFSTDTLRFDTVFTQLGSATRILKLYNRHKESIRISEIFLERGETSKFNLNVDGISGNRHNDIEIAPNDSLYVFAEVTINPNDPLSASPFVVTEPIVFVTNGNTQKVMLEAWGQNAVYLPSRFGAKQIAAFGCGGDEWIWDDPRPYVIYGALFIDDCTVRIPPGTRVHIHGGLGKLTNSNGETERYNDGFLAFVGNGRLLVEGTVEKPVIFEDDRLEAEFEEDPGQWTGIWLQSGTKGHRVENCIVRNSVIGIRADSAVDLRLRNTQIYNTANSALIGIHAKITAENCLFYNNTNLSIQVIYGGEYQFTYCTAASFGVNGEALSMSNALCLDAGCEKYRFNPLKARFYNCILYGSRADQISLTDRENNPVNFDYRFENCIVRVKDLLKANAHPDFLNFCTPCLNATPKDTIFIDPDKNKFRLDTMHSKANKFAAPVSGIEKDLDGKKRDATRPDAGCYEIEF
jgi:hypothetical protein